jgi:hypothetical protein
MVAASLCPLHHDAAAIKDLMFKKLRCMKMHSMEHDGFYELRFV